MGILPWDLGTGFGFVEPVGTPRLTVLCVYPDMSSPPSEVSFRLSPSYGLLTAREAHDWFLSLVQSNEEFEVETDRACDHAPSSFLEACHPSEDLPRGLPSYSSEQAQEVLSPPAASAVPLNRGE